VNSLLIKPLRMAAISAAAAAIFLSCAPPAPEVVRPEAPEKAEAKLTPEEQNNLAMAEYERLLNMTVEKGKRNVLAELEESYRNIIAKYPDAYLAQESYWWLILMNLEDHSPPRIERAESYYEEFRKKYPDSTMKVVFDDTLGRFYYRSNLWDKLIKISHSYVKKYIETDELPTPLFMFFYSEAKYKTDDLKEARKGYRIVINRFPDSTEAAIARERLDEIRETEAKGS